MTRPLFPGTGGRSTAHGREVSGAGAVKKCSVTEFLFWDDHRIFCGYPEPAILYRHDGTIVELNDAMARFVGGKKEDLVKGNIRDYLLDGWTDRFCERIKDVSEGRLRNFESYMVFPDGSLRTVRVFVRPIACKKTKNEMFLGVVLPWGVSLSQARAGGR